NPYTQKTETAAASNEAVAIAPTVSIAITTSAAEAIVAYQQCQQNKRQRGGNAKEKRSRRVKKEKDGKPKCKEGCLKKYPP
ncbi:hypothetical protein GWI33_013043, partial [Rhynchophorus ferrugineus]